MDMAEAAPLKPVVVLESEATCYTVRNDWSWAHIFVQHGVAVGLDGVTPRRWANLSVLSDYGEFGYCWSHIGGDWREFLASLSFDYAMRKMLGPRFDAPIDTPAAAAKARAMVLQSRRDDALTRQDARTLYDAVAASEDAHGCHEFLRLWDEYSNGLMYRQDLYDANWDEPSPAAKNFWREIWPHFIRYIAQATTQQPQASPGNRKDGEAQS